MKVFVNTKVFKEKELEILSPWFCCIISLLSRGVFYLPSSLPAMPVGTAPPNGWKTAFPAENTAVAVWARPATSVAAPAAAPGPLPTVSLSVTAPRYVFQSSFLNCALVLKLSSQLSAPHSGDTRRENVCTSRLCCPGDVSSVLLWNRPGVYPLPDPVERAQCSPPQPRPPSPTASRGRGSGLPQGGMGEARLPSAACGPLSLGPSSPGACLFKDKRR